MRKHLLFLILIMGGLRPATSIFAQKLSLPKWIEGTWHNSYESNTNNFVFWTFYKDSIFVRKGFLRWKSKNSLTQKYIGFKRTTIFTDSTCRVEFTKADSIVVYNFKLHKLDYTEKPVLTYDVTINGLQTQNTSTSINLVLTKYNLVLTK